MQIRRSIVKLGKQNLISRISHARNDKRTIAAWTSDLDRILQVFKVCPAVPSLPSLLTSYVQTELAIHTHVAVSDVRRDVASTRGIVSSIHHDVASTREIVSDIHRAIMKVQEGTDNKNQAVGNHCVLFIIEEPLQLPRPEQGLQFQL